MEEQDIIDCARNESEQPQSAMLLSEHQGLLKLYHFSVAAPLTGLHLTLILSACEYNGF